MAKPIHLFCKVLIKLHAFILHLKGSWQYHQLLGDDDQRTKYTNEQQRHVDRCGSLFYCNLGPRFSSVDVYINRQKTLLATTSAGYSLIVIP